jgi:hypothetical protein
MDIEDVHVSRIMIFINILIKLQVAELSHFGEMIVVAVWPLIRHKV